MRTLDELGISPAPWQVSIGEYECKPEYDHLVRSANGDLLSTPLHINDARLIAASPMLYEALRGLLNFMPLVALKDSDIGKAMGAAKAALAKASGESEAAKW